MKHPINAIAILLLLGNEIISWLVLCVLGLYWIYKLLEVAPR